MIPKDPTFFLFINSPTSSGKTYRIVVGVSDSSLSDLVFRLLPRPSPDNSGFKYAIIIAEATIQKTDKAESLLKRVKRKPPESIFALGLHCEDTNSSSILVISPKF